jgi:hypothetical protein
MPYFAPPRPLTMSETCLAGLPQEGHGNLYIIIKYDSLAIAILHVDVDMAHTCQKNSLNIALKIKLICQM